MSRDQVMLRLMAENLVELLSFSFDLTEGFEASESKLGKVTYNHFEIQKHLKEQGIIHKLIDILREIDPHFLIGVMNEKKNVPVKMTGLINVVKKYGITAKGVDENMKKIDLDLLEKIVNTSLKILRNCCKSNTQNSMLLFKNSQVIIKFLSLGTYAEQFIMDSFSNQQILQKLQSDIFKQIIDQYIKIYKLTNRQSQKIFTLLSKLIKYQDEGIGRNQLQLYRLFFYPDNPLMLPIRQADQRFYINGVELNDFCGEFEELSVFVGFQLKFCAEIASNRNYICSKTMKTWFPLRTLLYYLVNNPVPNDKIKESFVWLVIHCYLNERPRFQRTTQLVYGVGDVDEHQNRGSLEGNFEVEMEVMKGEGLSPKVIDDIFSCIKQGDEMTEADLENLKKFTIDKIH